METFVIIEQCDRALCQHDATDLMSMLVDSRKSWKVPIGVAGLAKLEVDKTLYCWSYRHAGHAKKDCPLMQREAQTLGTPKRKHASIKLQELILAIQIYIQDMKKFSPTLLMKTRIFCYIYNRG